ncbi:hypothetical protein [Zobellia alginiliquefaciens]|uniref:hypothetical protein n=1 Tax=Zobellia alginiliquefaciens TaxID=3032586 RepID=UPI0023E41255|nr:hypothetical protein [Zobellia alginiliquefaciens]
MTANIENKPPIWFWIISILALLWNLMGVFAYLTDAYMTVEDLANLSQEQRFLYESRPVWVTAAYATAVWAGALGCIALLMRKKWAQTILLISLIGVLAQNIYQFFLSNTFEVYGANAMVLPVMVIIVSVALVLFAKSCISKNWIS